MIDELQKVKDKIAALASKTVENGCTEEESVQAMKMVERLLKQYELTMTEVQLRDSEFVQVDVYEGGTNNSRLQYVIKAIGRFTDCISWTRSPGYEMRYNNDGTVITTKKGYPRRFRKNDAGYSFFGTKEDTAMAEYLFRVLKSALDYETEEYKKTQDYEWAQYQEGGRRRAFTSFQQGFVARVNNRLEEMTEQRQRERDEAGGTGRELIVLKGQLVKKELQKKGVKLKSYNRNLSPVNEDAVEAGREAGDRVNLGRPVERQTDETRLLGSR